jgi:hypothetical protein
MPKKLCCCDERGREVPLIPHWVAIPCVEYISELYDDIGIERIWPNIPSVTRWESGITYPYKFVDTPDFISFDYNREVYGMLRGGGGGGKTGDSLSEPVKGGNAAYIENIFAPTPSKEFIIGAGGSGPEALDIHDVGGLNYSGAKGYPKAAWGGALSAFGNPLEPNSFVSGGGGGGTKNYTQGGHGGITQGISGGSNLLEDAYGGWGADNLKGGTSGQIGFGFPATNPQNGIAYNGGRGQILLNNNPIVPFDYAGGGGAAGLYGGGGGASGGGGGGGLSYVVDGTEYIFPGTDIGVGSRCNPYFLYDKDYGLGAQRLGRSIEQCEVWEGCPDNVITFKTGTTGMHGGAATYFRNKWCTCSETQTEGKKVPVPNYICLTEEQYLAIISQMPSTQQPPGSDVRLSFVIDDVRYLLLYKCNLGCESKYLIDGIPSDVKWYVKGLSPAWFADFPQWSPDDVTSCCDCYDCEPICKGPEAPIDSPTPPDVRSCEIIAGSTCYWHLDNAVSKWYYKCRKSNCWADFGLESIVKPYVSRTMTPNTVFECGEDPCEEISVTWIANRCDLITRNECCETSQCCGPAQIKFCDNYLRKLLIPYPGTYPVDTNQFCYYFSYVGCIYVLSNFVTTPPCVPTDSTPENPINQGLLFAITNKNNLDCCREGLFAGGTDPEAVKPPPEPLPCEDIIVECFAYKDQFGVAQHVNVSSPMSSPGKEDGIEWFIRCRGPGAEPTKYPIVNPDYVQKVGLCYQENPSEELRQSLSAYNFGFHRYEQLSFYECPDCLNAEVICDCSCTEGSGSGGDGSGGDGSGGDGDGTDIDTGTEGPGGPGGSNGPGGPQPFDPCDTFCEANPQFCDIAAKAEDSYSIDTKYKVGPSGKFLINFTPNVNEVFYREDAFKIKFDLCEAQNAGISLDDEEGLFDYYSSKIQIISNLTKVIDEPWFHVARCPVNVGLEPEPLGAMCIKICDYEVKCFSGNAGHICEKINGRLNGIVEATGINPYFWFGWRRGCVQCGKSPNVAPPRFLGDDLEIDRGVKDMAAFSYTIYVAGVSQRWYVAVCQSMVPITYPNNMVINMSAGINHLSQAEYAQGLRYTMQSVKSISTFQSLYDNCPEVQICVEDGMFPNGNVTSDGPNQEEIISYYGFQTLANFNLTEQQFDCLSPSRNCDVYNLKYTVNGCDDEGNVACEGCDGGVLYPYGCNVKQEIVGRIEGGNILVN